MPGDFTTGVLFHSQKGPKLSDKAALFFFAIRVSARYMSDQKVKSYSDIYFVAIVGHFNY